MLTLIYMKAKSKFFYLAIAAVATLAAASCSNEGTKNDTAKDDMAKDGLIVPVGLTTVEELADVLDSHAMVVRMESPPSVPGSENSPSGSFVFYPGGDAETESLGTTILSVEGITYFKIEESGGAFAFPGSENQPIEPIEPNVWYRLEGEADFLATSVPLKLSSLLFPLSLQEGDDSPEGNSVDDKGFTYTITEIENGYEVKLNVSDPEIFFTNTTTRLLVDANRRLVGMTKLGDPEFGSPDERLIASYPKDVSPITAPANPKIVGS